MKGFCLEARCFVDMRMVGIGVVFYLVVLLFWLRGDVHFLGNVLYFVSVP